MDGNIQKALWIGVSIMVFIVVLGIGMTALSKGKALSSESMEQLDSQSRMVANTLYSNYDNQTMDGIMVVNAIKNFRDIEEELVITVANKSGTSTSYKNVTNTQIQAMQTKGNGVYINPDGEFYATITKDANDIVTGISFVQQ